MPHTKGEYYCAVSIEDPDRYTNQIWSNDRPTPHICTMNVEDQDAVSNAVLFCAAPKMLAALEAITKLGGNLDDPRLVSKTGANDAAARGLMYTTARSIALAAIAAAKGKTV